MYVCFNYHKWSVHGRYFVIFHLKFELVGSIFFLLKEGILELLLHRFHIIIADNVFGLENSESLPNDASNWLKM